MLKRFNRHKQKPPLDPKGFTPLRVHSDDDMIYVTVGSVTRVIDKACLTQSILFKEIYCLFHALLYFEYLIRSSFMPIVIIADFNSVRYLATLRSSSSRLTRYSLYLSSLSNNIHIFHSPGCLATAQSDNLSRLYTGEKFPNLWGVKKEFLEVTNYLIFTKTKRKCELISIDRFFGTQGSSM